MVLCQILESQDLFEVIKPLSGSENFSKKIWMHTVFIILFEIYVSIVQLFWMCDWMNESIKLLISKKINDWEDKKGHFFNYLSPE